MTSGTKIALGVAVGAAIVAATLATYFLSSRSARGPATAGRNDSSAPAQRPQAMAGNGTGDVQAPPTAAAPNETEILNTWGEGHYISVRDTDVADAVGTALAVDRGIQLPSEARRALGEKLAAFVAAYSGTDFKAYLAFRKRATLCSTEDPRLETLRAIIRQVVTATGEAVPSDPVECFAVLWSLTYEKGFAGTPLRPGPLIDEISWETSSVTVRSLPAGKVIAEEWTEDAGLAAHLYKEYQASGKPVVNVAACQLAIPNAVSAATIARRDGVLVFADAELMIRSGPDPGHPLVIRFIWDAESGEWLPLHALKVWNTAEKPLIW